MGIIRKNFIINSDLIQGECEHSGWFMILTVAVKLSSPKAIPFSKKRKHHQIYRFADTEGKRNENEIEKQKKRVDGLRHCG